MAIMNSFIVLLAVVGCAIPGFASEEQLCSGPGVCNAMQDDSTAIMQKKMKVTSMGSAEAKEADTASGDSETDEVQSDQAEVQSDEAEMPSLRQQYQEDQVPDVKTLEHVVQEKIEKATPRATKNQTELLSLGVCCCYQLRRPRERAEERCHVVNHRGGCQKGWETPATPDRCGLVPPAKPNAPRLGFFGLPRGCRPAQGPKRLKPCGPRARRCDPRWRLLENMFRVTQPADLGAGQDVNPWRFNYNNIELVAAWELNSRADEHQAQLYDAAKQLVRDDIQRLYAEIPGAGPGPYRARMYRTKLERGDPDPATGDLRRKLTKNADGTFLDADVNEKWLLSGTKPKAVVSMVANSVNERVSSLNGLFGPGIYLADLPEKVDQYTAEAGTGGDQGWDPAGNKGLHRFLYANNQNCKPDGELFYAFVAKVVLGEPALTKTGPRDTGDAWLRDGPLNHDRATSVYMDIGGYGDAGINKRDLANIKDTSPPVQYHSLIGMARNERGWRLKRFNEYMVYHGERVLLKYLVAYRRYYE